jgi:site-specific recombinase XerD
MLKCDAVKHWKRCQHLGVRRALEAMQRRVFRPPVTQQGPLSDLIVSYVSYCEGQRRGDGAKEPLRRLDRFLAARDIPSVAAVEPRVLSAFMATRRISRSSCELEVRAIRGFFRWLRRTGRLQSEPELLLEVKGPGSRHRPRIYTIKELASLLEALRRVIGWEGLTAFTLVHLIYACGLRISEALRLRAEDVDLERRILKIHRTKFRKSRQIPIGRSAAEYLRAYAEARRERFGSPGYRHVQVASRFFVMPRGGAVQPLRLRDRVRRACIELGLNRSGSRMLIHDLRHSFAVHRLYKWYAEGV